MEKKKKLLLNEILNLSTNYLLKHKIPTPRLDAELLIAKSLNTKRLNLYLNFDMTLEEREIQIIREYLKRRVNGEPVAYITGIKEFYSIEFIVGRSVLIPRPETEAIVDFLLFQLENTCVENPIIVDVGTGCGAIVISAMKNCKKGTFIATDINISALKICMENCKKNGLLDRISLINCDILEVFNENRIDIVVSNPPYIPTPEIKNLQREIKDYEPLYAIDGGEDGLEIIRKIIFQAQNTLKEKGVLILETANSLQAEKVLEIARENGFRGDAQYIQDISNCIRGLKISKTKS